MCELSTLYPKNSFKYEWAEEQTGYYAGFAYIENGLMEDVDLPDQSKEAYEMGFELYGGKDLYKFSKKFGTYYYECEDEDDDEEM